MFGQRIGSHLGHLPPDLATKVQSKQATQKNDHDNHSNICTFQIGDRVFVRNYTNGPTWLSGETKEIQDTRTTILHCSLIGWTIC